MIKITGLGEREPTTHSVKKKDKRANLVTSREFLLQSECRAYLFFTDPKRTVKETHQLLQIKKKPPPVAKTQTKRKGSKTRLSKCIQQSTQVGRRSKGRFKDDQLIVQGQTCDVTLQGHRIGN